MRCAGALRLARALGPGLLLAGAAPAASSAAAPEATGDLAPTSARSWSARPVAPATLRAAPAAGAPERGRLPTRTRWTAGPVGRLVLEQRTGADGRPWLRLLLPGRPNGRSAWVHRDRVALVASRHRVVVDRRARRVRLLRDGRTVGRWRAVVGAARTPTPRGRFAVEEIAAQRDPTGFLGPVALHLTARSAVLDDYGGGPGTIALHGRGRGSLRDPLGTARSHGCVRLDSRVARRLARTIRPGVPVEVR